MDKSIGFHEAALANYDEWIKDDPDNPTLHERRQYHAEQIERLRNKNRRGYLKRKEDPYKGLRRRIAWAEARIEKRFDTLFYYQDQRHTNPTYYDQMIDHAQWMLDMEQRKLQQLQNQVPSEDRWW